MSLNKAIEHGKEHRKPYQGTRLSTICAEITVLVIGAEVIVRSMNAVRLRK